MVLQQYVPSCFLVVLLFADFEEVDISHTLESPTWCFMQVFFSSFAYLVHV